MVSFLKGLYLISKNPYLYEVNERDFLIPEAQLHTIGNSRNRSQDWFMENQHMKEEQIKAKRSTLLSFL